MHTGVCVRYLLPNVFLHVFVALWVQRGELFEEGHEVVPSKGHRLCQLSFLNSPLNLLA